MLTTGTWKSDSKHLSAYFLVRHMMVSRVKGSFKDVKLTFEGDPDDLSSGKALLEIRTDSVETFDEKRDGHLKSDDFFNVAKYPKMTFESSKITRVDEDNYTVTGNLSIRGRTKEIDVSLENVGVIKDPYGNRVMGFSASGEFDREDFGLKWNMALEGGGLLVGNKVKFTVEGELVFQAEN